MRQREFQGERKGEPDPKYDITGGSKDKSGVFMENEKI